MGTKESHPGVSRGWAEPGRLRECVALGLGEGLG